MVAEPGLLMDFGGGNLHAYYKTVILFHVHVTQTCTNTPIYVSIYCDNFMCEILKHLYAEHKHYCIKGTVQPKITFFTFMLLQTNIFFIRDIHIYR